MCARRSGNILFYFLFLFFFAGNFTDSKDTEHYKTVGSILCQYICKYIYFLS